MTQWRNVVVSRSGKLSIERGLLVFESGGSKITLPPDDVNSIIVENPSVVISACFLAVCAERDIVLLLSDERFLPSGILLSVARHSRQIKVLRAQISMPAPSGKQLWKRIVRQKIENQSSAIRLASCASDTRLDDLAKSVRSGDVDNKEAVAARLYFPLMFGKSFIRDNDCLANSMMNFGYAVIRSMIARTLVAYGFHTAIGIHHDNELNQFNLADDLIEPYRPFIDLKAKRLLGTANASELTPEIKTAIIEICEARARVIRAGVIEETTLRQSMEMMTSALSSCLLQGASVDIVPLPILSDDSVCA